MSKKEEIARNQEEQNTWASSSSISNTMTNEQPSNITNRNPKFWIIFWAIFLRLFSAHYFSNFFENLPLFSTPWSSLKRLREGVFLMDSGENIYDGNLVHVLPMFLHALRPSMENPLLCRFEWMCLDIFCAFFLGQFISECIWTKCKIMTDPLQEYSKAEWLSLLAFAGYLLNPMTIGSWTVCNMSSIVNAFVSASMFFAIKDHLFASILMLALAIQLNPYYIILFAPIFLQFQNCKMAVILLSLFTLGSLFAMNFAIETNKIDLLRSTFGFFLTVPDLSPNNGIFWYFFTQIFDHYRLLFICVFQLNTIVYVVPLSALIRNNPPLLGSILLICVSLFSPYPSYSETALYLPTLAAFFDLHKYLRQRLLTGCTILASFVLSPIMWAMWVTIGSGNANFFFAIVWVFNLAQIFICADLISSYLRAELIRENGGEKEVEKNFEGVRLFNISPF